MWSTGQQHESTLACHLANRQLRSSQHLGCSSNVWATGCPGAATRRHSLVLPLAQAHLLPGAVRRGLPPTTCGDAAQQHVAAASSRSTQRQALCNMALGGAASLPRPCRTSRFLTSGPSAVGGLQQVGRRRNGGGSQDARPAAHRVQSCPLGRRWGPLRGRAATPGELGGARGRRQDAASAAHAELN